MPQLQINSTIHHSSRWLDRAKEEIDRSHLVLLVLSAYSVASLPCRLEMRHANERRRRLIVLEFGILGTLDHEWRELVSDAETRVHHAGVARETAHRLTAVLAGAST
jgi:hypothetical protein